MAARVSSSPPRRAARRRWWVASAALAGVLLASSPYLPGLAADAADQGWWPVSAQPSGTQPSGTQPSEGQPSPTQPSGARPSGAQPSGAQPSPGAAQAVVSSTVAPSAPAAPDLTSVLRLPGAVPTRGDGTFVYAAGTGKVLGKAGTLRRFRVAVERGSDEDVTAFAAQVEAALGDGRSWVGGGKLRLQRVAGNAAHDFTVHLATRETAGRMCRAGGVNITVGGRPYTSCRTTGRAIVNLDRWRTSAPTFTGAKVPLATYRAYVVNHEVGHELGERHQGCPRAGGPAPVMVQQTLTLRGCTPYPWPRRDGRRFVGPGR